MRGCVRKFFPKANGAMINAVACMFTNSTDSHFILDFHPCHPEVRRRSRTASFGRRQRCVCQPQAACATPCTRVVLQVILCSACSGHGFKFTSVIGEVLADLATHGDTRHPIGLHRLSLERPGHREFLKTCMPSSL